MLPTKWSIDPTHSEIQFKIKHLMISTVTGQFKEFRGEIETTGNDFTTAKIHFSADVNSIFTNNATRDEHLKHADFLDAQKNPLLSFDSEKMQRIDEENYILSGKLTLKGISKKVDLQVEFGGLIQDPWGSSRAGFTVSGKIRREDFGILMNPVSETGSLVLGEEVKILVSAQVVKKTELQAA